MFKSCGPAEAAEHFAFGSGLFVAHEDLFVQGGMPSSDAAPVESAPGEEVIQMKEEHGDNAVAADADTISDNSPTFCARVKQMWPLLVCAALETCFGVVRGVTFLSFIRTT